MWSATMNESSPKKSRPDNFWHETEQESAASASKVYWPALKKTFIDSYILIYTYYIDEINTFLNKYRTPAYISTVASVAKSYIYWKSFIIFWRRGGRAENIGGIVTKDPVQKRDWEIGDVEEKYVRDWKMKMLTNERNIVTARTERSLLARSTRTEREGKNLAMCIY
jgi:hypothetical protein